VLRPNRFESRLGNLPQVFSPLQSITERARQTSAQVWPLSWGSFPFGAFGRPEPTHPGLASPGTLRLQAFTASWRLASPDASRPYFMPVTPLGFALQSLSPSSSRVPLGTALPSCRSPSRFGSASGPSPPERGSVAAEDPLSDPVAARCSPGLSLPSRALPSPALAPLSVRLLPWASPRPPRRPLGRRRRRGRPPEFLAQERWRWTLSSPADPLGVPRLVAIDSGDETFTL
jgi:hypothetical protein